MSTQYSLAAFQRSLRYLYEQSRPLEAARARHHFEHGPKEDVYSCLSAFQNEDGGYGHGLEPDLRSPSSSPFVTSVAFQVLRDLKAPASQPLAAQAFEYLKARYDPKTSSWAVTPADVEEHPRAFWWTQEAAKPDAKNLNPRPELLRVLLEYPEAFDANLIVEVKRSVFQTLAETEKLEMHELLCVLRLAEGPGVSVPEREALKEQLLASASELVGTNPDAWKGYGLLPTDILPTPGGLLADTYREAAHAHCEYLIETVEEDGAWSPTWDWSALDAEAWARAKLDWKGVLTLKNLQTLEAFGRLASS